MIIHLYIDNESYHSFKLEGTQKMYGVIPKLIQTVNFKDTVKGAAFALVNDYKGECLLEVHLRSET